MNGKRLMNRGVINMDMIFTDVEVLNLQSDFYILEKKRQKVPTRISEPYYV